MRVVVIAAVGDRSNGEESSYSGPRALLSCLKACDASLSLLSPVIHQPESLLTPVINVTPYFLFISRLSFVFLMTYVGFSSHKSLQVHFEKPDDFLNISICHGLKVWNIF